MARSRWRLWAWPTELRRRGILSINRRNGAYVLPANPRGHYPRVDDKLLTKRICEQRGIPVPQTFAVIGRQGDVRRFPELLGQRRQFVVKPTRGSAGRGIVVVADRNGSGLVTGSGQRISVTDLRYEMSAVLAGLYSLSGQPDRAIIEQRIMLHPVFEKVAVGGTPDIRVILYRGVPVMAMVRLPTLASRGRGNLHQGAVGAGVDLATGETCGGVCEFRAVTVHPDTRQSITGLKIPQWNELLQAAMLLSDSLEMGFIGVDFVLDAACGPVILEANARPGLSIQIANRSGLERRLREIDAQSHIPRSTQHRSELISELARL